MATTLHETRPVDPRPGEARKRPAGVRIDRRARQIVSLLDLDLELARRVPADQLETARTHAMVVLRRVPPGCWDPKPDGGNAPLAYLVLEGTLIRSARVEERWASQLLGPEDVVRPWESIEGPAGLAREETWTVLEPLQVAVLDWRFAAAAARWPQLLDEILSRSGRPSARLMTFACMTSIRRLDLRLLVLLRILADRWGTVFPDGIHVDLPLTHETLARLACAQRPSVSTALARLERRGLVRRQGRRFVVPLELPQAVQEALKRPRAD